MAASPRFGSRTVSDLLTGPQVSCFVLLAADEVYVYGAAPAGQFQELHGAAEVAPSCEDGEDPLPGVVNIEYVAVTRDLVENFGDDAAGRMPAPFRDDGAWPDSDAVILAMPEGFAEELWDFQSAAASAPEPPPVLVELPGAGRGRGGKARGTAPAVPKGRPTAASNAADIGDLRVTLEAVLRGQEEFQNAITERLGALGGAGRGAPLPPPPGGLRAAAQAAANMVPGLASLLPAAVPAACGADALHGPLGAAPPLRGPPAAGTAAMPTLLDEAAPASAADLAAIAAAAGAPPTRRTAGAPPGLSPFAPGFRPTAGLRPPPLPRSAGLVPPSAARSIPAHGLPQSPPASPRWAAARANYAHFMGLPVEQVARSAVEASSAGVAGWAAITLGEAARHQSSLEAAVGALAAQSLATNALLARGGGGALDPMSSLLSGSDDFSGPRLPGAKGAAALEMYRRQLENDPAAYSAVVRRNARRAMAVSDTDTDPRCNSMREFFSRHVPFGKQKAVAYLGFGIATAVDLMKEGRAERAEATLLLLLVSLEQSCLDQGRWGLAWLLTHLPEPPWGSIQSVPPSDPLRPFGRLAEPGWTAAAMAFTKDAAALSDLRKRGPAADDFDGPPKPNGQPYVPKQPKGGGKGADAPALP